jgi:hypothetical protein
MAVLLAAGCGGTTVIPPPTRVPGGTVKGDYVLRIVPGPGCPTPASSFSFLVNAGAADTTRSPGIQILPRGVASLLPPDPRLSDTTPLLELELQYDSPNVRGGLGTTPVGLAAQEGFQVFVRAIASGAVSSLDGGPGEVTDGTLGGELDFGRSTTDPGSLGSCASEAHHWSLKLT